MQKRPFVKVGLEYRHYNLPVDFPIMALLEHNFCFPLDLNENVTYMHLHNCIEIGYCYSGEGMMYVESKSLKFGPNDISIVCPYALHISKSKKENPSKWEYLYIDPNRLLLDFFPGGFPNSALFTHDSSSFPNIISGNSHPEIAHLVLEILNELRYQKENYHDSIRGLVLALMIELSRKIPSNPDEDSSKHKERLVLSPAIHYINENYMKNISPSELAEICHMSVTHFRRIFKKIMGNRPHEYINRIRIRQACNLLYTTEISILDISLSVGFESISSFNRSFAQLVGVTPSKWRNNTRAIRKKNLKQTEFEYKKPQHNQ